MSLEIRKTSQWFYGRWQAHGKKYCKNLNVKIAGRRPASLAERGDKAFEKSRAKAEAELHRLQEESRKKAQAEDLVQALYEIRTGENIGSVALGELADKWSSLRRTRKLSEEYGKTSRRRLQTFADFIRKEYGKDKEMIDVTPKMAEAFLNAEEERGVSNKTWNDILILLRSAFHKLKREAGITENPFDGRNLERPCSCRACSQPDCRATGRPQNPFP